MTAPDRPGDRRPNDGPGPDGHHSVTGECFACMVGVATGPESHGDRCVFGRKPDHPGDRDRQQAAEVLDPHWDGYGNVDLLTDAIAAALAAARDGEKARRDKLVADRIERDGLISAMAGLPRQEWDGVREAERLRAVHGDKADRVLTYLRAVLDADRD